MRINCCDIATVKDLKKWETVMEKDKMRVLLVDDEVELVDTVVERLHLRGIDAKYATSGEQALELIKNEDFSVVVVDVKMPGLGGIECMGKIKDIKPNLPVLLLTGYGSAKDAEEGLKAGAYDYLVKPIDIEDLMEKMKQAIGKETENCNEAG